MDLGVVNDVTDQSRSTVRFCGDYVYCPQELIGCVNTSSTLASTADCRSAVLPVITIPSVHSRKSRLPRDSDHRSFLENHGDITDLDAVSQLILRCRSRWVREDRWSFMCNCSKPVRVARWIPNNVIDDILNTTFPSQVFDFRGDIWCMQRPGTFICFGLELDCRFR